MIAQAEEPLEMSQDNFHFTRGELRSTWEEGDLPRSHSSFSFLPEVPGHQQYQSSKAWGGQGCDPGQAGWWGGMKLFWPMPPTRYLPQPGAWQTPSASQSGWLTTYSQPSSLSKTDSHGSFRTSKRSRKDTDIFLHTKNKQVAIIRKNKEDEEWA